MSATGIGAAVRRKEDFRFITGQGQYTDDVVRPGETRAVFVRSPHARAKIKSIDAAAARKLPGVVAVLTGADLANDKIGNLICGWMIHSKDGSPMKAGPHPHSHCRQSARVAISLPSSSARRRPPPRMAPRRSWSITKSCRPYWRRRTRRPPVRRSFTTTRRATRSMNGISATPRTKAAFAAAKHVIELDIVNNRLVPNAMEPRAAIAEYDAGTDNLTLWKTSQNPHVARLVISAFVGIAPEHKLRVIAPDVGGGFGSKIFIYPEEAV